MLKEQVSLRQKLIWGNNFGRLTNFSSSHKALLM